MGLDCLELSRVGRMHLLFISIAIGQAATTGGHVALEFYGHD